MDIVVRRAGVKRLKTQASFPPHTRSLISFHSRSQHSPRAVGRSITRDEQTTTTTSTTYDCPFFGPHSPHLGRGDDEHCVGVRAPGEGRKGKHDSNSQQVRRAD